MPLNHTDLVMLMFRDRQLGLITDEELRRLVDSLLSSVRWSKSEELRKEIALRIEAGEFGT